MDDLDLIKEKINIIDLISEYLTLKRAGVNFKANCPFHQERTPSFIVSPERGIWHCFGCAKGGDIFKFVMEKEGLEFKEALQMLAKKAGVVLKKVGKSDKKERLLQANSKALEYFHYLLQNHALGKKALEYLKKRGLSDQTIKEFKLGYAPNSWDSLTNFLKKRGFSAEELIEAGLIVSSKSGGYDRFRGRIIFPLIDNKGEVVGFAGRILGSGEPKYINSPQTLIFDKSHFLFGLNLSKVAIRAKNEAILTEGEMDMILSFQSGVKNVVATKGTALTSGQIELIKKYAQDIILSFDMDVAGDSASRRGIEMADTAGLNIKVIQIKQGKDAADLILKDPKLWQEAVKDVESIYDFYLKSVSLKYPGRGAADKRKIAAELIPIWSKITDPVNFEHYLQKLSALISIPEEVLRKQIKQGVESKINYLEPESKEVLVKDRRELLEEYLIAMLLKIPIDLTFVPNFPETIFTKEQYKSLYVYLVLYLDKISFKAKSFDINEFVSGLPKEQQELIDRLYLTEENPKLNNSNYWQKELEKVVLELKKALIKSSLERLSDQIKLAENFGKIEQLEALNKKFRDLSVKLKNL